MNLPVEFLDKSKTAFHACANAAGLLKENGFEELKENLKWNVKKGGKYFVTRNGSSLIAFKISGEDSFNIVASHSDSPCFKIKANPEIKSDNYEKLNVERWRHLLQLARFALDNCRKSYNFAR